MCIGMHGRIFNERWQKYFSEMVKFRVDPSIFTDKSIKYYVSVIDQSYHNECIDKVYK